MTALTETYKHLHRSPELSRHEEKTSAFLAEELRKLGYFVTENVRRYTDGSQADGVVAVMEDSPGPRLLISPDMDVLPVEEKTGLNHASTLRSTNEQGQEVGVMHACGSVAPNGSLLAKAVVSGRINWADIWPFAS